LLGPPFAPHLFMLSPAEDESAPRWKEIGAGTNTIKVCLLESQLARFVHAAWSTRKQASVLESHRWSNPSKAEHLEGHTFSVVFLVFCFLVQPVVYLSRALEMW
jgi:hypothetical protein